MSELIVREEEAGERLDVFLGARLEHLSRRGAQAAVDAGLVRVNGRRTRKGVTLRAGDRVSLAQEVAEPQELPPNPALGIPVLYEDESLLALDKPPGVPAHALEAQETHTAANFLLSLDPSLRRVGRPLEAGLVHRLDTDTSGVLLAARTEEAHRELRRQFRTRAVTKEYLALVHGEVHAPGELRHQLSPDPRDERRVRATKDPAPGSRPALTLYRPVERFRGRTLLAVQIVTGERHQIRSQLAAIGRPVVGDALYGPGSGEGEETPGRHLLHALRLVLTHPTRGNRLSITSPVPEDLERYIQRLRGRGANQSSDGPR